MTPPEDPVSTVFYVTADYPPDNNAGSARATAILEELSARGSKIIVLSHKSAQKTEGINLRRLPVSNPQSDSRFLRRILRELLLLFFAWMRLLFVPRNAIIVVSSPPFFLSFLFIFLPRWNSVKHVLDVRDLYPDVFVHAGVLTPNSLLFRLLARMERCAYARSDLIFTVCGSLADRIRERSPHGQAEIVMNGYSRQFENLSPDADNIPKTERFTIIAHGNFGRFQDVELIRQLAIATAEMPLQYRLIGFGAKLRLVEGLPNVQIEQARPHDEIPQLLQSAHMGLSFRTSDDIGRYAVPVKLLEYQGAYLPSLVVPVTPDLEDLARAGAIQQFEAGQLKEMVAFLEKITTDSARYTALVDAVSKVRHLYSRRTQAQRAADLILQLSAQRQEPA